LPSLIGFYSLVLGSSLSFLIIFFSIKNFKNSKIFDRRIIFFSFLQFLLVFISFFGLIISFINSDFSNETVFNHSHTTKPLFYKISGTWGNHEGSLLLWLLVLTLFVFLFIQKLYVNCDPPLTFTDGGILIYLYDIFLSYLLSILVL